MALYSVAQQQVQEAVNIILGVVAKGAGVSRAEIAQTINSTITQYSGQLGTKQDVPGDVNSTLADIVAGNATQDEAFNLTVAVETYILQSYGYIIPVDFNGLEEYSSIIDTAYLYLFISAGPALLTLAGLLWIGKRNKSLAEYAAIGIRVGIGSGLCLSTLLSLDIQSDNYNSFINSGWVLPMLMLSLGLGMFVFFLFHSSYE